MNTHKHAEDKKKCEIFQNILDGRWLIQQLNPLAMYFSHLKQNFNVKLSEEKFCVCVCTGLKIKTRQLVWELQGLTLGVNLLQRPLLALKHQNARDLKTAFTEVLHLIILFQCIWSAAPGRYPLGSYGRGDRVLSFPQSLQRLKETWSVLISKEINSFISNKCLTFIVTVHFPFKTESKQ